MEYIKIKLNTKRISLVFNFIFLGQDSFSEDLFWLDIFSIENDYNFD